MDNYQDSRTAQKYLEFLASNNGQIQQKILWEAIKPKLPKNTSANILDAACGNGWLTKIVAEIFINCRGCDNSEPLINIAKKEAGNIEFKTTDLQKLLPYSENFFDAVILNMAAPDISNLAAVFENIFAIIKKDGQLILTLPNPYYTYPVGVWKRNISDFLLMRKPKLRIRDFYASASNIIREFNNGKTKIASNFYPLSEYITKARTSGFTLVDMEELRSKTDSQEFDLNYQLYRYPLLLLLEFVKPKLI